MHAGRRKDDGEWEWKHLLAGSQWLSKKRECSQFREMTGAGGQVYADRLAAVNVWSMQATVIWRRRRRGLSRAQI